MRISHAPTHTLNRGSAPYNIFSHFVVVLPRKSDFTLEMLCMHHIILSRTVAPRLFFWGFFLPMAESGSPQILILPIAESSVVHKILLKLSQRFPLTLWKI